MEDLNQSLTALNSSFVYISSGDEDELPSNEQVDPEIPTEQDAQVEPEFDAEERDARTKDARQLYLITYSQADAVKVPSHARFAEMVCAEFNRDTNVVQSWVCGAEIHHKNQGFHYHLALKLLKSRRFRQVKINLANKYGVNVRFTDWHTTWEDCVSYVLKQDKLHAVMAPGETGVTNGQPGTSAAIKQRMQNARTASDQGAQGGVEEKKKRVRLDELDLHKLFVEKNIKNDDDLCYRAKLEMKDPNVKPGQNILQHYILRHSNLKQRSDFISSV